MTYYIYTRTPTRLHYPARLRARVITRGSVRYSELTDFQLNPRDGLRSGTTEGFEISYKGKAMIGD